MYLSIYFLFIIYVRPVAVTTKRTVLIKRCPPVFYTVGSCDKEIYSPTPKIQNTTQKETKK